MTRIARGRVRKRKAAAAGKSAKPRRARKPPGDAAGQIRKAAQRHGVKAVEMLWAIAAGAESDSARIAALKEILDRGYGKESRYAAETEHAVIRRIERIIVDPKN